MLLSGSSPQAVSEKKGPKQSVHKEALPQGIVALPQGQYTFHFAYISQKGLLFDVASSSKPLSHVYSRPITSPFVDKLAMNV